DAVDRRHADVHQHHVRVQRVNRLGHPAAVGEFSGDFEAELRPQDAAQSRAHQFLVVDKEHPDHAAPSTRRLLASGSTASTSQPRPPGPAWQVPPIDSARSRMLIMPSPEPVPGLAALSTVSRTLAGPTVRVTAVGAPAACLAAFVSASWAMR